jgi:hypothetical protein
MWPTNDPAIDFTIVATLLFERLIAEAPTSVARVRWMRVRLFRARPITITRPLVDQLSALMVVIKHFRPSCASSPPYHLLSGPAPDALEQWMQEPPGGIVISERG